MTFQEIKADIEIKVKANTRFGVTMDEYTSVRCRRYKAWLKRNGTDVTDCATRLTIDNQIFYIVACVLCLTAVLTQYRNYFCFFVAIGKCD